MNVIRSEELTRVFDTVRAVDGISLSVAEGEIYGLVGPDGAGKTTTMRLLTGILTPSAGRAWVLDYDVAHDAEPLKTHIGYMSQRFGLYPDLSVLENLAFYADLYDVPRRGRGERVDRLLAFSGLAAFRRRLAGRLSGGMKQKLGLACALIHTPRVLFLDEPTNGVDPVSRRDFWRILYQLLRERVTIFVSTAYLDEAERCNRLALMHHGRLIATGTPAQIKQPLRGRILELRTPRARDAANLLRAERTGESVALFGERVHIVTPAPDETTRRASAVLASAGIDFLDVRGVEPTLEDVFVSTLGSAAPERADES